MLGFLLAPRVSGGAKEVATNVSPRAQTISRPIFRTNLFIGMPRAICSLLLVIDIGIVIGGNIVFVRVVILVFALSLRGFHDSANQFPDQKNWRWRFQKNGRGHSKNWSEVFFRLILSWYMMLSC